MKLFDIFKKKSREKAVFLGLDNSGKSTIISFLQEGRYIQHTPTMGKKKLELDVSGTRISLFDMGGQEDFRQLWLGEMKNAKCVVFVIDKSAPDRFPEAKAELSKLISIIQENNIGLLILANKHDLPNSTSTGKLIREFELFDIDDFEILEISAKTGYNMAEAFTKFYSLLTGKQVQRSKFSTAVSVYNKGGVPIISQFDKEDVVQKKAIEGGFLVAITQFCNMTLPTDDDASNMISFESEDSGTFLVAKSRRYIGSLLWDKKLGVPIEQSKVALRDLLEHLECACEGDQNNVNQVLEHYITNII